VFVDFRASSILIYIELIAVHVVFIAVIKVMV